MVTYVEAPPTTPRPYGLFSAALVLNDLDGHSLFGVQYEPLGCGLDVYDTVGACAPNPDFGSAEVSVSNARGATLTLTDEPSSAYTIDWGDGTVVDDTTPDGATHTYTADGTYDVVVTDDRVGYRTVVPVTVTNGSTSGPFTAEAGFSKVVTDGVPLVTADPFTLYHLHTCRPVGGTDVAERARAALSIGEQHAAESHVAARLLPFADGAVDVTPTPGTALHPVDGIAALEDYAATVYGGLPVLHMRPALATVLTTHGTVVRGSGRLETVQGAPVAAGGGYTGLVGPDDTTPTPAGPGQAWVYATGLFVVHRQPQAMVTEQVMTRTPAVMNTAMSLAERAYTASWECFTAAVLVDTDYVVP